MTIATTRRYFRNSYTYLGHISHFKTKTKKQTEGKVHMKSENA